MDERIDRPAAGESEREPAGSEAPFESIVEELDPDNAEYRQMVDRHQSSGYALPDLRLVSDTDYIADAPDMSVDNNPNYLFDMCQAAQTGDRQPLQAIALSLSSNQLTPQQNLSCIDALRRSIELGRHQDVLAALRIAFLTDGATDPLLQCIQSMSGMEQITDEHLQFTLEVLRDANLPQYRPMLERYDQEGYRLSDLQNVLAFEEHRNYVLESSKNPDYVSQMCSIVGNGGRQCIQSVASLPSSGNLNEQQISRCIDALVASANLGDRNQVFDALRAICLRDGGNEFVVRCLGALANCEGITIDQMQFVTDVLSSSDSGSLSQIMERYHSGSFWEDDLQRVLGSKDLSMDPYQLNHICAFISAGYDVSLGNPMQKQLVAYALSSSSLSPEQNALCIEALSKAWDQGCQSEVFDALEAAYLRDGLSAPLLQCLSECVRKDGLNPSELQSAFDLLQEGAGSNDSAMQESSMPGFLNFYQRWQEEDMVYLSENIEAAVDAGLTSVAEQMDQNQAQRLADLLLENIQTQAYCTIEEEIAAVTALGALSNASLESAGQVIKDAVIDSSRFGDEVGAELTIAGIGALMQMAGSRNFFGHDRAAALLQEDGWPSAPGYAMDDPAFRQELVAFATGTEARSELSPEAQRAGYESGLPVSIPRMFRDRGAHPALLDSLAADARTHYDDAAIRNVLLRIDLYNSLPSEVQTQLQSSESAARTGEDPPGSIDAVQVIGQLANGTLHESVHGLLLSPIENHVADFRAQLNSQLADLRCAQQSHNEQREQNIEDLAELVIDGVPEEWGDKTAFEKCVAAGPIGIFLSPPSVWPLYHDAVRDGLNDFRNDRVESGRYVAEGSALETTVNTIDTAMQLFEYSRLKSSGRQIEADRLALAMLADHGSSLGAIAPEIWQELGLAGQEAGDSGNPNIFQRAFDRDEAESAQLPEFDIGTEQGPGSQAHLELCKQRDDATTDQVISLDVPARRALALEAIDTDPALAPLYEAAQEINTLLPGLQELVQAGACGSPNELYAQELSDEVRKLRSIYEDMTGGNPSSYDQACLVLEELESLERNPELDPDVREQVEKRITALEDMLAYFDEKTPAGKELKWLFEQVEHGTLEPSMAAEAARVLGGLAVSVGTMMMFAPPVTPVTGLAKVAGFLLRTAGSAAFYVLGEEATASFQHHALDIGEGSTLDQLNERRLVLHEDGIISEMTAGEAWGTIGVKCAYGAVFSGCALGLRWLGGKGIQRALSTNALSANPQSVSRFFSQLERLQRAAGSSGMPQARTWLGVFAQRYCSEVAEEGLEEVVNRGMESVLGEVNPALSIVASALTASRDLNGGFNFTRTAEGDISVDIQRGCDALRTMQTLQTHLENNGVQVNWNGTTAGRMTATTADGATYTLQANSGTVSAGVAPAHGPIANIDQLVDLSEIVSDDRISRTTSENASTVTDTDSEVERAATELEHATVSSVNPDESEAALQSYIDHRILIRTEIDEEISRLARDLGEADNAEIEQEIKELLMEEARQYAVRLGLVVRDENGNITDYLINPEQISLVRGEASAFHFNNTIEINIDGPRPTESLWHEMIHQKYVYALTVQRMAADLGNDNDGSFERRIQEEVFSELETGDSRVIVIDGDRTAKEPRSELIQHPELRRPLGDLLRGFSTTHTRPEAAEIGDIEAYLAGTDTGIFQQHDMSTADVAGLMLKELQHYGRVLRIVSLRADGDRGSYTERLTETLTNSGDTLLLEELSRRAEEINPDTYGRELEHLTSGIVESRLGIQDQFHYRLTSPFELEANIAQLSRQVSLLIGMDSGADLTALLAEIRFNKSAWMLTRRLAQYRTETDPELRGAAWLDAQAAALELAGRLPVTAKGQEMARYLLDLDLIEPSHLPQQLQSATSDDTVIANDQWVITQESMQSQTDRVMDGDSDFISDADVRFLPTVGPVLRTRTSAEIRLSERGAPAQVEVAERTALVDGVEMTVRTPLVGEAYARRRDVVIGDRVIELFRRGGWFYSPRSAIESTSQVKLHVATTDAADLSGLQMRLLPMLEDLRLQGLVSEYKTFDPNLLDSKWDVGRVPGPTGQSCKGFTIYLDAQNAAEVAAAIDQYLVDEGMSLEQALETGTVGDVSRLSTESRRVSIERESLTAARSKGGQYGGFIDQEVVDRLAQAYPCRPDGRLTREALLQIESDLNMVPGQLTFDADDKLMFVDPAGYDKEDLQPGERIYISEVRGEFADSQGRLSGREALYELYQSLGLDPAQVYLQNTTGTGNDD